MECPVKVRVFRQVAASHSLIVLSPLAEAKVLPSGLKTTDSTLSLWPSNVTEASAVARSHSLIVLSLLAEASVLPSGLNARDRTEAVWPARVMPAASGAARSRSLFFQSPEPLR